MTLLDIFGSTQPGVESDTCTNTADDGAPNFLIGGKHDIPSTCEGRKWFRSGHWGSDKEVGTWFGVRSDEVTGRVVKLDLNYNGLFGTLPDLSALSEVRELDFRGNNLTGTIPSSIGGMTALTELLLSANTFTGKFTDVDCTLLARMLIYAAHSYILRFHS